MRGRPPAVGLHAIIVAVLLAMLPSGAALAEQFPTPEAATKPKVIKKAVRHPFRPTMPARNPVRSVSAAAEPSDEAATTDEDQADEEPIVVTNLLPPEDPFELDETDSAETEPASNTDDSEKSDNATETADEMSNKPAEQPTVVTDLSPPARRQSRRSLFSLASALRKPLAVSALSIITFISSAVFMPLTASA